MYDSLSIHNSMYRVDMNEVDMLLNNKIIIKLIIHYYYR